MKTLNYFLQIVILGCLLCFSDYSSGSNFIEKRKLSEQEHQDKLREDPNSIFFDADKEFILWDKSRIDLVTDTHVIEIDFAEKWKEAIGQSLYYEIVDPSDRKCGIILLIEKGKDDKFVYRCQAVCAKYGITLFVEPVMYMENP